MVDFKDISSEDDARKSAEAHLVGKAQQDSEFRKELIRNPKPIIEKELGVKLPSDFDVKVFEETSKSLYLVIPVKTEQGELSDQLLEAVAGGKPSAPKAPTETYYTTDPVTGEMDKGAGDKAPATKV